ncbi:MAG: hypothetical protein ACXWX6_00890 [Actinomycetota bacterium]
MWLFPVLASLVALAFAALLGRQFARRRRSYQAIWAVALLMYAGASLVVALGAANGWTSAEFRVYWALGAVLNVPFLAQGELDLLIRNRTVRSVLYVVLVFITAYTIARVRTAATSAAALAEELPSGKEVFGDGTPAHRLPQLVSIPAYLVLVGGATWSAWRMRGRVELRDRFWGTLGIALGATVIAGFGSAFAALGELALFSVSLLVGISIMFWGFLRASRQPSRPEPVAAPSA